jgi:hypothetical protein
MKVSSRRPWIDPVEAVAAVDDDELPSSFAVNLIQWPVDPSSSTLAMKSSGAFFASSRREACNCHKSSAACAWTVRNVAGSPPLVTPLFMIATRGFNAPYTAGALLS